MEKAMHSVESKTVKSGKLTARLGKAALGAILLGGVSGAAVAQNMVVRSTGPSAGSYPAGINLDANANLTLTSQDMVTVLGEGGTRVFTGPRTYSLNSTARSPTSSSTRLASCSR